MPSVSARMSPFFETSDGVVALSENNSAREKEKVTRLAAYTDAGPITTAANPPSAGPMIEADVL